MNFAAAVVALYGLFSLIGGIIGYVKAKSTASLIAGSLSGIVLLICGYWIARGSFAADIVSLVVAVLLGVRFFKTWRANHRVMPDLLMVIFSAATLFFVGIHLFQG